MYVPPRGPAVPPRVNADEVNKTLDQLNRSLPAEETNVFGRVWTYLAGKAKSLEEIRDIFIKNKNDISQLGNDRALRDKLVTLYNNIKRVNDNSQNKNELLNTIEVMLHSQFAALMLRDIEDRLPEGQFEKFKRDPQGYYVNPIKQLADFRVLVGNCISADDYVAASKTLVQRELDLFTRSLPDDLRKEQKSQEIALFLNASNRAVPFVRMIPRELSFLKDLQKLSFNAANCGIDFLPTHLNNLTSLEELDLRNTRIHTPQDVIYNLPALRKLSTRFLPDLTRLPPLTILRFSGPIATLPDFSPVKDLKELQMRITQMKTLPPTIAILTQLNDLDISSNDLENIQEIQYLSNLAKLNVCFNARLIEIPIGHLHQLKEIICDPTQIKLISFPQDQADQLQLERIQCPNVDGDLEIVWEKTPDGPSLSDFIKAWKIPLGRLE